MLRASPASARPRYGAWPSTVAARPDAGPAHTRCRGGGAARVRRRRRPSRTSRHGCSAASDHASPLYGGTSRPPPVAYPRGQSALVLAVDDLQWLDPGSAHALRFAVRRLDIEPVGILATPPNGHSRPARPVGHAPAWPSGEPGARPALADPAAAGGWQGGRPSVPTGATADPSRGRGQPSPRPRAGAWPCSGPRGRRPDDADVPAHRDLPASGRAAERARPSSRGCGGRRPGHCRPAGRGSHGRGRAGTFTRASPEPSRRACSSVDEDLTSDSPIR